MIPRDATPSSHVSPYRRIEIGRPIMNRPLPVVEAAPHTAQSERDRIWKLVVQSAQGTTGAAEPEKPEITLADLDLITFAKSGGPI
jgi:hypothetical protein